MFGEKNYMRHDLKIKSKYFKDILINKKTFEIRYNDRNYKENDFLVLNEIDNFGNYTGNIIICKIIYILKDFVGLAPGYLAFSIRVIHPYIK